MYRIVSREQLGPATFQWDVHAPDVARACEPGHFLMVRIDELGERIPLTVADFDSEQGTVTVVVQAVGKTTNEMMQMQVGDEVLDFIGPLGLPSNIEQCRRVVLVGGGLGVAPIFPQLRLHSQLGSKTISVVGFRNEHLMFWLDRFEQYSDDLRVATNDGSYGTQGLVTDVLEDVLNAHDDIDEVIAIGPLVMMKACAEVTRSRGVKTTVSLNSIMIDGTGMCGSCRCTVGGEMKFACVDGPEFDAHQVNFDELIVRQTRFQDEERDAMARYLVEPDHSPASQGEPSEPAAPASVPEAEPCRIDGKLPVRKLKEIQQLRTPMPERDPAERAKTFDEVALGYGLDAALAEAQRCLLCKKPKCVPGCPVSIDIPAFIEALSRKDIRRAYEVLRESSALPAVCGRVCPQETQCEQGCVVGSRLEPVAIGRLERFVADFAAGRGWDQVPETVSTGKRAAIIGSGPAGLACAGDLAKAGVDVTVYEALHMAGGVLKYGIPEFRLPNDIIDIEVEGLAKLGVKFELDKVIGKVFTIRQLIDEMGFDVVFIGIGAGTPKFMGIPGESLNGVVSANEFLTRVNLMQGYRNPHETPVGMGRKVAVIGAGNTAMDAARVAMRMGTEVTYLIYRRSENECPARREELHHAVEEGLQCKWLTNPVQILGDDNGRVTGMELVEMELGEPDDSGRRRPVVKAGTEHVLDVDMVIYALGTAANPVIAQSTPGLSVNGRGYIEVDDKSMTSIPGVFAGGDIVTGSATVILAMGLGRQAAAGMLSYLGLGEPQAEADPAQATTKTS